MEDTAYRAIAIVGTGAILPDAPNVAAFWENVKTGRYSITDVTPDRWDPAYYYDPDPSAPDKTYSKIGGWVREYVWDPMKWHMPIPPRVTDAMDQAQKWAIAATREALEDYGYPKRPLDADRVAVILGNAMAGEKHYLTSLRIYFPEYAHEMAETSSFAALPEAIRSDITRQLHDRIGKRLPEITEDTMPGELSNCIAGRIANIYNFHGPNFVCDAACASAMAAMTAAVEGLVAKDFDAVITGGIDRNMGASTFVKFCKIGALSATGTRPFAEGADGFVMGEGCAIFLMKRLADAERDGDKIYAVLRGIGASSDGKGKGITAPNPVGQKFCLERGWQNAGLSPATATLIEGHGTSTRVGDVVEAQSLTDLLKTHNLPLHSVALGSVKSNIGHLKGAAGAAGLLKTTLALRDKVLPPSVHCEHPSPDIDFAHSPVYVNTELKPWTVPSDVPRRAGVSAFGFGGTNFHLVLEEHIPHKLTGNGKKSVAVGTLPQTAIKEVVMNPKEVPAIPASFDSPSGLKAPLRGALVIGADSEGDLAKRLSAVIKNAEAGRAPEPAPPAEADLRAPERLAIDYADAADLADKAAKALKALSVNQPVVWKALRAQGIFRGQGPAPRVAFLYTGQGSQYVNMLRPLYNLEPIVAKTFAEADRVMTPLLGKPLTDFIFVDQADANAVAKADEDLRQTEITQPAVLAIDLALTRLLAAYGIQPDMTMGHSLGEYGALVASGALPFDDALEAVSARGRGMTKVAVADKGRMAAVFAPLNEIERILKTVNGYVVIANINSEHQAVIGGASDTVGQAMEILQKAGYEVSELPVSHAFHTSIVAPASEPLRGELARLHLQPPRLPIVANVNGEFYPTGPNVVPQMLDILARQVASPVQFVKGLHTLYDAGARVFVEVGPKKALQGFAEDVLSDRGNIVSLFTNHPKFGDVTSFNQALCGLYAAGLGRGIAEVSAEKPAVPVVQASAPADVPKPISSAVASAAVPGRFAPANGDHFVELGHFFADVLERGWQIYHGQERPTAQLPVVITGAALGLPGTEHIFDDDNITRILRGDQFIDLIPTRLRKAMLDKHITRLVKSDNGGPTFETINNVGDVIKLAGRGGALDLEHEFGVQGERVAAFDRVTQLAIAVGIDALRDAGIPLVMRYKTTSKGTQLPDRWGLPESLRNDTGVIFASAFPGYDSYADEMGRYYTDQSRREQLALLENLLARAANANGDSALEQEVERRLEDLRDAIEKEPYVFDRRFLLRVLSMGHSQFAEFIGARGPNTQINSACASTTQAVSLAEDWINAGRCRRVIVVSADDITSDHTIEWFGAGFLASGAAATDEVVEEAATPFDRRRHGMIVGMGAAGFVVESADAARERGIQAICEVMSTVTANSAFHATRLDVQHISGIMEELVSKAEAQRGISRKQIAPHTVFVSHETYTPARGGSASAEINALRHVFGDAADQIVIANTKGMTGHAMGSGIEDVLAVKSLETGVVPPVANFKEVDPELGTLNLSKGGSYPVEYALRLGAGFGSQISMSLLRWVKTQDGTHRRPNALGYSYRIVDENCWKSWLSRIAGYPTADLEVVHRTLRVRDQGPAARIAEVAQKSQPAAVATVVRPPAPVVAAPPERPSVTAVQPKPQAKAVTPVPAPSPAVEVRSEAKVEAKQEAKAEPRFEAKAAPAAAVPLRPATEGDPVRERVLALVAEKTGYPVDMLDLDLDLEADLGVDTVKQAEVFASIREAYGIVRDETVKLREFPTLAHVIRFVHQRRPELGSAQAAAIQQPGVVASPPAVPEVAKQEREVKTVPVSLAASGDGTDPVKERILALVVEKTGYPQEMLDLDLDLEADLGVDTVKQAEMFAAIREIYNIPRDENRKLRDYPTLAHVIRFVHEKRPDLGVTQQTASTPAIAPAQAVTQKPEVTPVAATPVAVAVKEFEPVKERILALVVEKTGYPQEMLDLDLDLEADLGIDTVKQAEMFAAIREIYNIPRDENRKLRDYPTLAHVIRFVYEQRPELAGGRAAVSAPSTTNVELVTPPALAVGPADTDDPIKKKVLQIVAEKTGYPEEMLDLDLDLEADLGVDTVKQAEMFAAVRAAYNIPRDEALKLRDFPTLAHVIKFAHDRAELLTPASALGKAQETAKKQKPGTPASAPSSQSVRASLASFDAANRIPRRVPTPILRPPLSFCKATSAKLDRGSRVVLMPDKCGVADALVKRLQTMGVEVLRSDDTPDAEALTSLLKQWAANGPIQGVYWLPALDAEGNLRDLDLAAWHEAVRVRVKSLYTTMRSLYEQVAGAGTFLVSATRIGGQHGYDEGGASNPLGGAVVGFSKTYKRERAEALVKAIDFELNRSAVEVADLLIEETLRDPGAVEIGYTGDQRWTIGLEERPAADGQPGMVLDKNTVFVITGAAGSIVSAITTDLAAASGGTFYLLDLVPKPDPDNPDLKRFANDKENLKRDLFARIQARGERATPALVEKELANLERAKAAQTAIDAVRIAGGTPHYFSVNLADALAVGKVIDEVRQQSGRIDVLLHAAGVERSHSLPDKDPREFDLVFDVKSDGFFNLLHAIGDMPLGSTVAFSSIAGRFGNVGQTDYSAANDLLCKITSNFRTKRPATRGIAIDWTAWGGIGMATRGSIPKIMELAGIDMLPPEAGIPLIRRELTAGATRGEIVIGQRLGVLLNEWDATGGLDTSKAEAAWKVSPPIGPMVGKVASISLYNGHAIETTLDPKVQPFLHDHQIDGTPVLPGVMGVEAFAEAALCLLPSWRVEAIEDVNFLAPFKFYRGEPRTLRVETRVHPHGGELLADCQLIGRRSLPSQATPQSTTHFTARVRLSQRPAQTLTIPKLVTPSGHSVEAADIYRLYFHGPAYQVIEKAWWDGHRIIGLMANRLPDNHYPPELPTLMAPRLIELCFQTAGVWEMGVQGRMGLPQHIDRVAPLRAENLAEGRLYAVVTPYGEQASFDAEVVDEKGNIYVSMKGYRTVALAGAVDLDRLKPLQAALSAEAVLAA